MYTPFDNTEIAKIAASTEKPQEVLEKLAAINREYWELENADEAERCRHRDAVNAICARMRALQHSCPHPADACEFNSDPYQSYYSCNICGADEVRPGRKKLCG
jgi:hypothetical protein